jgi:hypothetical protein
MTLAGSPLFNDGIQQARKSTGSSCDVQFVDMCIKMLVLGNATKFGAKDARTLSIDVKLANLVAKEPSTKAR